MKIRDTFLRLTVSALFLLFAQLAVYAVEQGTFGANGTDGKNDKDPGQPGTSGGSGSITYTPGGTSLRMPRQVGGDGGKGGRGQAGTIFTGKPGVGGKGGSGGSGTVTIQSGATLSHYGPHDYKIGGNGGAGGYGGDGALLYNGVEGGVGGAGGSGTLNISGVGLFDGQLCIGGDGGAGGNAGFSTIAAGGDGAKGGVGGAGTLNVKSGGTVEFTHLVQLGGKGGVGGKGGYGTSVAGKAKEGGDGGAGTFNGTGVARFNGVKFVVGGAGGRGGNGDVGTLGVGGPGADGGKGGDGAVTIAKSDLLLFVEVFVGGDGGDGGDGDGGAGAAGTGGAGGQGGSGSFTITGGSSFTVARLFKVGGDGGDSGDGGYGFFAGGGGIGQNGGAGGEGKVSLAKDGVFEGTVQVGGHGGSAGDGVATFTGDSGEGGVGGAGGQGTMKLSGGAVTTFHKEVQIGGNGGEGGEFGGAGFDVGTSGAGGRGGNGVLEHTAAIFNADLVIGGDGGKAGTPRSSGAGAGGTGGTGTYSTTGDLTIAGRLIVGGKGADGLNAVSEGARGGNGGWGGDGTVTFGGDTLLKGDVAIGGNGGRGGNTASGSTSPGTGYGSGASGSGGWGGNGTVTITGNFENLKGMRFGGNGANGGTPGSTLHLDQLGGDAGNAGSGGSGSLTIDSTGEVKLRSVTLGGDGGSGFNGGGNNGMKGGDGGDAGAGGNGTLIILNGTVSLDSIAMGGSPGSPGYAGVGHMTSGMDGQYAGGGTGTLDIRGGETTVGSILLGGDDNYKKGWAGNGTLNISGGSTTFTKNAIIGYQRLDAVDGYEGSGTAKITGGYVRLEGDGALYLSGIGNFSMTGGTLSSSASAKGSLIESDKIAIGGAATLEFDLTAAGTSTLNLVLDGKVDGDKIGSGAIRVTGVPASPVLNGRTVTLVDTDSADYVTDTGTLYLNDAATAYVLKRTDSYWYALATDAGALQLTSLANPGGNTAVAWNAGDGVWDVGSTNWTGNIQNFAIATYEDMDDVHFTHPQATGTTVTVQSAGVNPASMTVENSGQWTFTGGPLNIDGTLTIANKAEATLELDASAKNLVLEDAVLNVSTGNRTSVASAHFGADSYLAVAIDASTNAPAIVVDNARDWTVDDTATLDIQGFRFSPESGLRAAGALQLSPVVLVEAAEGAFSAASLFKRITFAGNDIDGPLTRLRFINGLTASINEDNRIQLTLENGGLAWYNGVTPGTETYNAHGTFHVRTHFQLDEQLSDNESGQGAHFDWDGKTLTKTGDGILVLTAENSYSGGAVVEAGTLRATSLGAPGTGNVDVEAGGAFEFAFAALPSTADVAAYTSGKVNLNGGGFNLKVAADYTLADDLRFARTDAGSTVTLHSPGYAVTLASGKTIDAGLANFTVGANTTLAVAGKSSITAANAIFAGIVDLPAASALTVNGDASLPTGGAIRVGADADSGIGSLRVGGSFTVEDNAGAANIFFGSEGREYENKAFLTADAGIVGGDNLLSNFFQLKVIGNKVFVGDMFSQEDILNNLLGPDAVTPNLRAGASAADANWDALSSELQDRIKDYVLLFEDPGVSPAVVSAAFRQFYGEYAAYSRRSLREDAARFQSAMRNRLDRRHFDNRLAAALSPSCDAVYDWRPSFANRIWGGGFGSFADQDSRNGTAGYEYKSGGVVLGYDHAVSDNFVFGFAGAYARGRTDVNGLRTRYDSDAFNAGVYAAWFDVSGLYAKAGAGFGYGWNDYDANLLVGGGKKQGDYHSQAATASVEFGREWSLPHGFTATPSIGVDFAYVRNGGWRETARGDAVAGRFESGRDVLVDIPLTARVGKVWDLGAGCYIASEANVSWIYSAADRREKISASFAGAPFVYNQKGVGVGRGRVRLGASVKARLRGRTDVSLDYSFETRSGFKSHNLNASVGLSF